MNTPHYRVTKTYGHHLGLSAIFRQHKASSHCRFLHGYALSVKLTFVAPRLNNNNWVIDFGSLKPVKAWLETCFDHKLLIAEDDPQKERLLALASSLNDTGCEELSCPPVADAIVIPAVGCEGFAKYIADNVERILFGENFDKLQGGGDNDVMLESVEVREHDANSGIYYTGH